MQELLAKSPNCYKLLEKGNVYYIVEENDVAKFVEKEDKWNLEVNTKKKIDFYQIDDCIICDNDYKRVDWMIKDDESIYFIEVKDVIKFGKARKEAFDKLEGTLLFFNDNSFEIDKNKTKYILNLYAKAKNIIGKTRNSAVNTLKLRYKEQFGINYEEGNSIYIN